MMKRVPVRQIKSGNASHHLLQNPSASSVLVKILKIKNTCTCEYNTVSLPALYGNDTSFFMQREEHISIKNV
jgi:hypothetical protein